MTDWGLVESLFEEALSLAPERRAGFVEAKCPSTRIREQVESLLRHATLADGFLEHPPTVPEGLGDDAAALVGQTLGAYTIDRELASGGMGHVYSARRADGEFDQRVAIKVIRFGLATPSAIERFRAERRMLAHLDHPRIARLIDGGTTPDGRPYFVMEYVEGTTVTAAAERLTLDGRIALFLEIADAVAYAHSRLIVHRDLKPGNILVGADGHAKLLDFGVAKLLTPETSSLTAAGERPMTPQYASPEQVRGEAVTTATDVYALGLLLFEMLTGRRPYEVTSSAPEESGRVVCETTPSAPSVIAPGDRRYLRGDLDRIVLKAIAKDPGERYRSAIELLADVKRWRRHEPVAAAPDSASYRAGKFLRRHRAGVALASAAVLALSGGVVAAGMGYWRANAARHAETEQRLAAQQIGDFLDDMLGSIDPNDARDRDTALVREVLDKASRRLTEVPAMSPSVRMPLERRVGESYAAIWELDAARDHLERARTLIDKLGWQETLEAGEVAHWLGFLANAEGRLADAQREVERGLEIRRQALPPDDPKLGESLSLLGAILMEQARYDEARPVIEESVSIWRRHRGARGLTTLNDSTKLAGILLEQGKNAEAISVLESIRGSLDDADRVSPAGAAVFNMLGIAYKRAGDLERAEGMYAEALEVSRKVFGEDHPGTLTVRGNLANVIENLGRLDEAKREQLAVLVAREHVLGERHPDTITSLGNLTLLCSKRGEHDEAIEYGRRATRLSSEVFGDANPNAAMCRGGLGIALKDAGGEEHLLEAERHMRQCYEALVGALGNDHPATRRTRETLAELYGPDSLDRPDELANLESATADASRDAFAGSGD